MKSRIVMCLVLMIFFGTGCVKKSPPDYQKVQIIKVIPMVVIQDNKGKVVGRRQAYTVIQDSEGIRYKVSGELGEVGDEFSMNIADAHEVD